MRLALALLAAAAPAPALAQHAGHTAHEHHAPPPAQADSEQADAPDHGGMDHSQMDHGAMGHETVDHPQMEHGHHGHAAPSPAIPTAPPPPEAGSGPPRAADAIWGAEAMRASREELRHHHGGQRLGSLRVERLEYRAREGEDGYLWEADAWYGGDLDRLWLKSEGEGAWGEEVEDAEIQALYSRAIGPWFDLQAGVRQDLAGPARTHAVVGVQGLAPYLFEVDAAAYLSTVGDLTARLEAELDQRVTQRLILQPRVEMALAAQDVPELGIGAGIDSVEAGARLRYEIVREFAPYVGVEQEWKLGGSADYARAAGASAKATNIVLGVQFWF